MSDSVLLWLALAVSIFWAMGAYNRLMRLRSQGIAAFTALESLLRQQALMVKTHLPQAGDVDGARAASQEHDAFSAAWVALAAAAEPFNAALKLAHAKPLDSKTMETLRTAHETVCLSWSRLRDLPPDLAGPALPHTLHAQWEHVALQVDIARTKFNRLVANYNAAITQFPALLLARVFGFQPAQPI